MSFQSNLGFSVPPAIYLSHMKFEMEYVKQHVLQVDTVVPFWLYRYYCFNFGYLQQHCTQLVQFSSID